MLKKIELQVHSDSDYAMDRDTRKSTTGFAVYVNGNLVDWGSKLQSIVTQSSCEAEFVAGNEAVKRAQLLRKVLCEMIDIAEGRDCALTLGANDATAMNWHSKHVRPVDLKMDNLGAVFIANTGDFNKKLKHIEVRFYYLAEQVEAGRVTVTHVPGKVNPADLFTKAVSPEVHGALISRIVQ